MTVYELIRKLTECDPDREVRFRFDTYFYGAPEHFDEYIDFHHIENDSYSNEAVFKLTF